MMLQRNTIADNCMASLKRHAVQRVCTNTKGTRVNPSAARVKDRNATPVIACPNPRWIAFNCLPDWTA